MNTFLEKLAGEVLADHGKDLASVAVVFPTRRAGLFFRKALASKIEQPVWMPEIFSIQDFIRSQAGAVIPDTLTLQVELYKVYRRYFPDEDFGSFLPRADVLLKDFDEADRYLVHAPSFFRNIAELKEVEESFGLAEEDEAKVREFWKAFYDKEQGALKKNFYDSWRHLQNIYSDFREALTAKGWAYEGMAYRRFSESLQEKSLQIPHSTVYFAGLYALSKSEESILENLVKQGKAKLYWDTDNYYTDDEKQEAGAFIRKNKLIRGEDYRWKSDYFATIPKQITAMAVPLQVGQARSAGQIIDELVTTQQIDPRRIAVLLADEKMLFPVLYSLPQSVGAVNVTMGFPLRDTPVYHLLESLSLLQRNARDGDEGVSYYHKHVAEILSHPYVQLAEPAFCAQWFAAYREHKWMRIPGSQISGEKAPMLIRLMFKPALPDAMPEYFGAILEHLLLHTRKFKGHSQAVESEFLFQFFTQMNRLKELLPQVAGSLDHETFWYVFRQVIGQVKIPFTGEPLEGMQIMGLLESRLLDFDYLIFLSVNEDILPAASTRVSYVPYGIRKAFGLPGHEENHAVSSYHFYRLMQRATGITLLYNSEAGALSSGERSRFISQLQLELARKYPDNIRFEEQWLLPEIQTLAPGPIIIEKNEAVRKAMEKFLATGNRNNPYARKISPSALSTYVHCPLKFYFSYVAGLRETEEVDDEMDARVFGEVLHQALQNLYVEGVTYSQSRVEELAKAAPAAVDRAIKEKYNTHADKLEGKNIVLRNVLAHLVVEILNQDSRQAPFSVLHLEKNFIHPFPVSGGNEINIGGVVDRIDEKGGAIRILDYKTGKVEWKKVKAMADLFSEPKHKEQLQTWLYAWLYSQVSGHSGIRSGLVVARELGEGVKYVNDGNVFSAEQLGEFETHLRTLLDEIYNPAIPFKQTEDEQRCRYCSFKEICTR